MIEAAEAATEFVAGRQRSDFDNDHMLFLATIKAIEIIGEAASRLSLNTREGAPNVPWSDLVAMRNRLTHVYFDVNPDIVWQCVTTELPQLLSQLRDLLGKAGGNTG